MFFDMHADVWTDNFWEYKKGNKDVIRNKYKERFLKGGLSGGIFVIYLNANEVENPEEYFFADLRAMTEELHYARDLIKIIKEPSDFKMMEKSLDEKNKKFGVVLGIEGLPGIGNKLDYLYLLYQLGVRHIGMTWNETNAFATGQSGDKNRGLTPLGIDAVKIINELGILLDVSHANDKTFWNIVKHSKKPFFASHSNARSLCPAMRNLTDDQILCIGEHGGMVGMNSYHNFVSQNESEKNLEMLLNHLEYVANKIGLDKVGFGLDFAEYYTPEGEEVSGLSGLHDVTELRNVEKALKNRGYSLNEIEMVTYKNFIDFFGRVRNFK
ncbi:peptidase M19 [Leptotrichia shahii]|uniref:Peptidase M19 n=1 Tax=Leptotrichia shahii TaxID=157691 RepID=A0A510JUL4_9FUSO|nr:membrane dipeptidase [Leptotrichia shahii]BBM41243.1 peptidase M19 [Leptotrichia shahii]